MTNFIHDNPVAMFDKFLATIESSNNDPRLSQLFPLFKDVKLYITELEDNNRTLRNKLSENN